MCIPQEYVVMDLSEIFFTDKHTILHFLKQHEINDYGTPRTYFNYIKHQLIKDYRNYITNGKTLH